MRKRGKKPAHVAPCFFFHLRNALRMGQSNIFIYVYVHSRLPLGFFSLSLSNICRFYAHPQSLNHVFSHCVIAQSGVVLFFLRALSPAPAHNMTSRISRMLSLLPQRLLASWRFCSILPQTLFFYDTKNVVCIAYHLYVLSSKGSSSYFYI